MLRSSISVAARQSYTCAPWAISPAQAARCCAAATVAPLWAASTMRGFTAAQSACAQSTAWPGVTQSTAPMWNAACAAWPHITLSRSRIRSGIVFSGHTRTPGASSASRPIAQFAPVTAFS